MMLDCGMLGEALPQQQSKQYDLVHVFKYLGSVPLSAPPTEDQFLWDSLIFILQIEDPPLSVSSLILNHLQTAGDIFSCT